MCCLRERLGTEAFAAELGVSRGRLLALLNAHYAAVRHDMYADALDRGERILARRAGLSKRVVSRWADKAIDNDQIAACPPPALARVLRAFRERQSL